MKKPPGWKATNYKSATEMIVMEQAKRNAKMNYLMAKSLVEGKVDSRVLRWAEEVVHTQKYIYEKNQTLTKT